MKNLKLVVITLLFSFMALACQQQQPNEQLEKKPINKTDTADFALAWSTAQADIDYYDSVMTKYLGSQPIKSFTVRSVDLFEAMGINKSDSALAAFKHVRVYLGMDPSNNQFKLFLTPVVGACLSCQTITVGTDSILSGPYRSTDTGVSQINDVSQGQYVLDFNNPCPPTCVTTTYN